MAPWQSDNLSCTFRTGPSLTTELGVREGVRKGSVALALDSGEIKAEPQGAAFPLNWSPGTATS